MHSAFNLFVFPNYMFTSLLFFVCVCVFFNIFYERAMSSPEKYHLKITIIIIISPFPLKIGTTMLRAHSAGISNTSRTHLCISAVT